MELQTVHLIEKAQRGNIRALNQLFSLWYERVYNIAWKYFADEDLAMEACQAAFVAVQRHLNTLQDPSKFKYWLYRIVVNQCHLEHRQQKQMRGLKESYSQNIISLHPEQPDQAMQREETTRLILKALQQLPEEQRTVLILKEYEGLKFREIADLLEISENTAKARLYYGLENLKKILLKNQASKEICHG